MKVEDKLIQGKKRVDNELERILSQGNSLLFKAMRYSVLSGGKRFRPLLVLCSGECFGVEWREINVSFIKQYLGEKGDRALLEIFESHPSSKGNRVHVETSKMPELTKAGSKELGAQVKINGDIEGDEKDSLYHTATRKEAREHLKGKVFTAEEKKVLVAINEAKRRYYEVDRRNPENYSAEEKLQALGSIIDG